MIDVADLHERFVYNPLTGHVTYRVDAPPRKKAGERAGSNSPRGYRHLSVNGKLIKEHRAIWAMMTGSWPVADIDHIDRDRSNNVWANLREATRSENLSNQGLKHNNKSGFKGVNSRGNSHVAVFRVNGKLMRVGPLSSAEEAAYAYDAAVTTHLGQFAVTNKSLGLVK